MLSVLLVHLEIHLTRRRSCKYTFEHRFRTVQILLPVFRSELIPQTSTSGSRSSSFVMYDNYYAQRIRICAVYEEPTCRKCLRIPSFTFRKNDTDIDTGLFSRISKSALTGMTAVSHLCQCIFHFTLGRMTFKLLI